MAEDKFKINDRVKKLGTASIHGTVVAVRREIISSSAVNQDLPAMINVQWDNGSRSYFAPEALEMVKPAV